MNKIDYSKKNFLFCITKIFFISDVDLCITKNIKKIKYDMKNISDYNLNYSI